jgi:hypothetical protein
MFHYDERTTAMPVPLDLPRRARVRPLADLADALDVTPAAIYAAAHRGQIGGVLYAGAHLKISIPAYAYHAVHGYGRRVPAYGTPEVEAYLAAHESADADAA